MKRRKFNIKRFLIAIVTFITLAVIVLIGLFIFNLSSLTDKEEYIRYEVRDGSSTSEIINNLESDGLIRSALVTKIYLKLFNSDIVILAGSYKLSPHMSTQEILEMFKNKKYEKDEEIILTFKEGISIPKIIQLLESQTDIKKSEVLNTLNDTDYINSLINEYWFLTKDILNTNIYYSLEGYLFPNTYNFYKNATVKDIFKKMLDETSRVLTKYKTEIEKSNYSIHEILTLASIVQAEGTDSKTLKKVSSALNNRLNTSGWRLQSCSTAYYGAKLIQGQDKFGDAETRVNSYNTYVIDGLPVGPIANPGEAAIDAALNPAKTDYYFFISDSALNMYFSRTLNEHNNKINELVSKGMWAGS